MYLFEHALSFLEDFIVPKPQYSEALRGQPLVSLAICR